MSLLQFALLNQPIALVLLVLGSALIIAEAFIPGAHFIVVGVALFLTGLIGTLFGPFSPLILAGIVLLSGGVTFYGYRELELYPGESESQPVHSGSLQGTFGRVTEQVTPTGGEVKLEEGGFHPYYSATSEQGTIEEGEEIVVTDPGGGNVVTVAPVNPEMDAIDRELARETDVPQTEQSRETESDDHGS